MLQLVPLLLLLFVALFNMSGNEEPIFRYVPEGVDDHAT
jgi:hypothetical protein